MLRSALEIYPTNTADEKKDDTAHYGEKHRRFTGSRIFDIKLVIIISVLDVISLRLRSLVNLHAFAGLEGFAESVLVIGWEVVVLRDWNVTFQI
ncbi:MAG: hypothetical protein V5A27_03870 [Halapricum sp.]